MDKLGWLKRTLVALLLCVGAAIASPAQTFTTLYSFCSQGGINCTDGAGPYAGLVQGANGNLYGTTSGAYGYSTVFKTSTAGRLTTIYRGYCAEQPTCDEGWGAAGGLVQATNGEFYGTMFYGPEENVPDCGYPQPGCGTVFKIGPAGGLSTVSIFCATGMPPCAGGSNPWAGLTLGTDGNFYGTTVGDWVQVGGSVFKITPAGVLTTLYTFCSQPYCADGEYPYAGLVQGTDGNFYGTTQEGGDANGIDGGTVFKITPAGMRTTLYSFCSKPNCADGAEPTGTLVQGIDGNFYGTTGYYGANEHGTVFKMTPAGKLTTLYSFCAQPNCADGSEPWAGLVQATDGNFYGTTLTGGVNSSSDCLYGGCGTVFRITPGGALTTLYSFCAQVNCTDGGVPFAGLLQATNGTFYGTTWNGGAYEQDCSNGCGTVFSLSVGLGPFVETRPTSGKIGRAVQILGTNLTGATSVTFNGAPATFKVVSATEITTTVPEGATTGTVQVVTPSGTLTSNVNFRVAP